MQTSDEEKCIHDVHFHVLLPLLYKYISFYVTHIVTDRYVVKYETIHIVNWRERSWIAFPLYFITLSTRYFTPEMDRQGIEQNIGSNSNSLSLLLSLFVSFCNRECYLERKREERWRERESLIAGFAIQFVFWMNDTSSLPHAKYSQKK